MKETTGAPSKNRRRLIQMAGLGMAGILTPRASSGEQSATSPARSGIIDVTAFGARGDGKSLDTDAFNQAIATAAQRGGTVYVPAGTYLVYSIHLRSNITLELAAGVVIQAAEPGKTGFDLPESNAPWEAYQDFGHNHWHNSLIWGDDLENISIVGPGLIWGKSLSRGEAWGPVAETPGVGNKALALKNCRNVLLRDFSILHGGHFGILATGIDNLTIDNLKIDTNRDGMDIDCCRNVRISNCSVNSPWDDAIVLKSSYALGRLRSTEAVSITNCYVTGGFREGTLLDGSFRPFPAGDPTRRIGRIKFGTESNGGFKNIVISNCVFESCYGLAIESVDGAHIEDVTITNVTMRNIVTAPLFIRLGDRLRGPKGTATGVIRRVRISNVICSNSSSSFASILSGIPGHPIENISLNGIYIQHQGGISPEHLPGEIAESPDAYPEPEMFGLTPAQGFFVRHVEGLHVSDLDVTALRQDARPVFVLNDVRDADFTQVRASPLSGSSTFAMNSVRNFRVSLSSSVPDTSLDTVAQRNL